MKKGEAKEEQEKLGECEQDLLCIAVYNCQDTSCKCVEGSCVEK